MDLLTLARPDLALGGLDVTMGVRVLRASAEPVVATGSWAAVISAGPGGTAMGVDLNITHHRGARAGTVTATAIPLPRVRSSATDEVVVADESDRRLATARVTNVLRDLSAT